jgi:hypothetical protein
MFIIIQLTQFLYKHTMHLHNYMFRPIVAIIRYTEILLLPFFLSAVPLYTSQCLNIGSALYRYVVYVMPLCYKMY